MHPLLILLLGTLVVVLGIVRLRIGAFFSLVFAALLVSFLAPGELGEMLPRVLTALGTMAGKLSLIITCAAVIGKCMTDSGAADRIVQGFLHLFGEKRIPAALMSSGFVLSMPVFFDTVFYLLVPLARSLYRTTKKNYLLSILAIATGAAMSHTLVPPTPGPLAVAGILNVEVGMMMLMGIVVGLPVSIAGLWMAHGMQRRFDLPMRPIMGMAEEEATDEQPELPSLFASLLPILLPVVMIATGTIVNVLTAGDSPADWALALKTPMVLLGDPNTALLVAAVTSVLVYLRQCRPSRERLHAAVEVSLMSAATIILITSAGAAFGAMLKEAGVGQAMQNLFSSEGGSTSGLMLLVIAWLISSLMKISQGSTTVAVITAAGMIAAMLEGGTPLPFHPVYLALAIGFGGLFIVWMNDSGFWIICKMSGFTETETLKVWSSILALMAVLGLILTILLATVLPMAQ